MRLILLVPCLLACALNAQAIELDASVGIGGSPQRQGFVAAPCTPLVVHIRRPDARPLQAELVVELSSHGRRGRFGMVDTTSVRLSAVVDLPEGNAPAPFEFELPVTDGAFQGNVTLVTGAGQQTVAETRFDGSISRLRGHTVAFISRARLGAWSQYYYQDFVEIAAPDLPANWKLLSAFDAIVLNDEGLSRAQSDALVDYVSAGGVLLISPTSAASFNPELPAARLIGATNPRLASGVVQDHALLTADPQLAGVVPTPGAEESPHPWADVPVRPDGEAALTLYDATARVATQPVLGGLASTARVGAGLVVLLRVDLSQSPLATGTTGTPTAAGVNALSTALTGSLPASTSNPLARLAGREFSDVIEIAGRRIPGRDVQILWVFVYVLAAGVGLFLLARRMRRPEVYPGALLVLAVLSVLTVFGLGAVFKRTGDRVRAVRVVTADGASGRSAIYSIGCAYVVDGDQMAFSLAQNQRFAPLNDLSRRSRRGGDDLIGYSSRVAGGEVVNTVDGLTRWQNLYFAGAEPASTDLRLRARAEGDTVLLENLSGQRVSACLVVFGTSPQHWHLVPVLGPAGSPEATAHLSQANRAPADADTHGIWLRQHAGDDLTAGALAALLGVPLQRDDFLRRSWSDVATALASANLLPGEGEYLLIGVLPPDALGKGSLGLRDLDQDRITQVLIMANRGTLER